MNTITFWATYQKKVNKVMRRRKCMMWCYWLFCIDQKMHRLLDEQSLLCSQLRLLPPEASSRGPAPSRTVATQCCLLPWYLSADLQSGPLPFNLDSSTQSLPGSESEGLSRSPSKADKLDIVSFLQRVRRTLNVLTSITHSETWRT